MKLHELFESPSAKEFLAMLAKQNEPPELKVYEVKSKAQYNSLLNKFKIIRGVLFNNKIIVWNAHDFAHINYYERYGKEPNTISFMTDGHQFEISSTLYDFLKNNPQTDDEEMFKISQEQVRKSIKQIRQSVLGKYLPNDVEFVNQETGDIVKE